MKPALHKTSITVICAAFVAVSVWAQGPAADGNQAQSQPVVAATNRVVKVLGPTAVDMNCSGFISPTRLSEKMFVAGTWDSPYATQMADREYVHLAGEGIQMDGTYAVMRKVLDLNKFKSYKMTKMELEKAGTPYAEVARVHVIKIDRGVGIATITFSCDATQVGDILVPYVERPVPQYHRPVPFDVYASPDGMLTGRIILAKDMDYLLGTNKKVYLNKGSNDGVKPGDYFRVTRSYDQAFDDKVDKIAYQNNKEDLTVLTPIKLPNANLKEMPRRSLAELMVLYTTPTSATAMVTYTQDAIYVGDNVEKMPELPPLPPPPPPPAQPPTITCTASPNVIRTGESATVTCQGNSPDGHPLHFTYVADAGQVIPHDNIAIVTAVNTTPAGPLTVMSTVIDDRNLSASTTNRLSVEIPPPSPMASNSGLLNFKPASGYVDNRSKAFLDGVALRLQKEPGSSVELVGGYTGTELGRISMTRANNAKTYLTKDKGIDPKRVTVADGGFTGRKVDVWFVPAGANTPAVKPVPAPVKAPAKKPVTKKPAAVKPAAPAPAKPAPAKPATTTPAKPGAATPATTPAKPAAGTPATKPGDKK